MTDPAELATATAYSEALSEALRRSPRMFDGFGTYTGDGFEPSADQNGGH